MFRHIQVNCLRRSFHVAPFFHPQMRYSMMNNNRLLYRMISMNTLSKLEFLYMVSRNSSHKVHFPRKLTFALQPSKKSSILENKTNRFINTISSRRWDRQKLLNESKDKRKHSSSECTKEITQKPESSTPLSMARCSALRRYLDEGDEDGVARAYNLFDRLLAADEANVYQCNEIVRYYRWSPEAINEVLCLMKCKNIFPNVATYTMLMQSFIRVGNYKEANTVLNVMKHNNMSEHEILTTEILSKRAYGSQNSYSVLHTLLQRFDRDSKLHANIFFMCLLQNGLLHSSHVELMFSKCMSVEEIITRIEQIKNSNETAVLNTECYNILITKYQLLGQYSKAKSVVNNEMYALGILPNDATYKSLKRKKGVLSQLRIVELSRLCDPRLDNIAIDEAMRLFAALFVLDETCEQLNQHMATLCSTCTLTEALIRQIILAANNIGSSPSLDKFSEFRDQIVKCGNVDAVQPFDNVIDTGNINHLKLQYNECTIQHSFETPIAIADYPYNSLRNIINDVHATQYKYLCIDKCKLNSRNIMNNNNTNKINSKTIKNRKSRKTIKNSKSRKTSKHQTETNTNTLNQGNYMTHVINKSNKSSDTVKQMRQRHENIENNINLKYTNTVSKYNTPLKTKSGFYTKENSDTKKTLIKVLNKNKALMRRLSYVERQRKRHAAWVKQSRSKRRYFHRHSQQHKNKV